MQHATKHFNITWLLLLFMSMMSGTASAYDAKIDGIYYTFNTSNNTARVTYHSTSYNSYPGDVTIPETVTYNGKPYAVTSIGGMAFFECSGLTSVTIPSSVTSIGDYAFSGCSGLTAITIPNSVTSIGYMAFEGCSGLTAVHITDLTAWCGISFSSNPLTYAHHLYLNGEEVKGDLIIPNSVTSIGGSAFSGCSGLTSVTIPNSVTSIGGSAFSGCSGLTSITLNNNSLVSKNNSYSYSISNIFGAQVKEYILGEEVTSIGSSAFYNCSGLTSVTIPNSVTSIGESAFDGCSGLKSVTIPNSVTSIGESAFYNCSGLTSVTIPNSVTSIGSGAFQDCSGLTSVTIPSSVTSIDNAVFAGCSRLTAINIPNSVTSIDLAAFDGCSGLTSVTIPNSVTSIGYYAFENCSGLTAVTIPNSVTSIGGSAFYGCSGLTAVRIGNNVTEIPGSAFGNCTNLTSVVIGDGVYKINGVAFSGCKNLESIISVSPTPPIIESSTFETITYKHAILKVPLECKSRYWSADYWKDFAYIEEMDMTAYREGVDMEEGDKASRYATFYDSQSAYTLPAGLKASVVTGMSSGKLVYKVIAEGGKSNNVVPKGVAVMLTSAQEDASAYTLTPTESDVTYTGTNWLYGSDEATTTTASGNSRFYKLSYGASDTDKSEVFGWYWGAANGGAFSIAGHKAWLAVPMVAGAPTRSFSMEGDATDIVDIETTKMQNEDEGYYDLQGRRVTEPVSRGIYIHKGKKIIIR